MTMEEFVEKLVGGKFADFPAIHIVDRVYSYIGSKWLWAHKMEMDAPEGTSYFLVEWPKKDRQGEYTYIPLPAESEPHLELLKDIFTRYEDFPTVDWEAIAG